MNNTIYTVGHSTRSFQDLIDLLSHYDVDALLDIRAIPYSRYNPQFNRETMIREMPATGIRYEHIAELGGVKPSKEVMAAAKSCSERSRGFADHMRTDAFRKGLDRVLGSVAEGETVALMCAESDPSHCHRFWVADAVQANGPMVMHIVSMDELRDHPANLFTYE